MPIPVFPALPGLGWNVTKTPEWATKVQRAVSGKAHRVGLRAYPVWHFGLRYEVLRAGTAEQELQTLMGFFNARRGALEPFHYRDPTDDTATLQLAGYGDGSTRTFQLVRAMGAHVEPVHALVAAPRLFLGGIETSAFTADLDKGTVTFNAAPAVNVEIRWSGNYYFRVRFKQDTTEFENFLYQLWSARRVELVSDT